ncbi:glucan biosynthesis protein G [Herminiimonas sp. NPDC097707]|uniref:glucan biosynthesis protein G n=1 Tax=Herminiimonas sp. NPDC097707 TaxID=3364007 RepID=UPI00383B82A0
MLQNFFMFTRVQSGILLLALSFIPCVPALAFDFNDVARKARQLAATSYKEPQKNISKGLENLDYDQYRDIRYKRDSAYWRSAKLPFELTFFHQGRQFESAVKINEITGNRARPIPFDARAFDYGANKLSTQDLKHAGFSGFRVHYALNKPTYKDELVVFLGASYLRAVGKEQIYGLSARGLAVDTALNSGEEFPRFVEFWIARPAANSKQLTIYALLDSRRVSGAYRFIVKPGEQTITEVKSQLYLRENVSKLGIAPLTSMYFFGENQRAAVEDYRPEVHDSDGLSIQSGTGEWIWRPLVNPKRLLVTSYTLSNPSGFGLMQRDAKQTNYEDLEARYEARPSAWVEPMGKWGAGRVELVQIPTPNEFNDNIVAYWVPDQLPKPGVPINFDYRLSWLQGAQKGPPLSWVTQTRRGHGYLRKPDDSIALFVDFEGPIFKKLPKDAKINVRVSADSNGEILESHVVQNPATGGWRAALRIRRVDDKKPVELRGFLHTLNTTLSETWSYILPAD